jgi:hypothetical protein
VRKECTSTWRVAFACSTHDDVGWLKTFEEYYSGSNNTIQHAGVVYILDSVMQSLSKNPDRKFIYVEQAYFDLWWAEQDAATRVIVQQYVAEGRWVGPRFSAWPGLHFRMILRALLAGSPLSTGAGAW